MSTNESTEVEDTDVKPRLYRALTEYHTVIHERGNVYSVTSQSGREYTVDARDGRCTCPDAEYNLDDGDLCKHALRVAIVRGERVIPAAVDRDEIDTQLGIAVDSTPVAVATDGGTVHATEATNGPTPERPSDCECLAAFEELPCWPCYRDGFETSNLNVDAGDENR